MPVTNSALERLRKLAAGGAAQDNTRVAPKPTAKPLPRTVSALPEVETVAQVRERRGKEEHKRDIKLAVPKARPVGTVEKPPKLRMPTADDLRAKTNPIAKRDVAAGRVITPPSAERNSIGERIVTAPGNIKPDYLRGLAREKANAANYEADPVKREVQQDVADRLDEDARIEQERGGHLRAGVGEFAQQASFGTLNRAPAALRDAIDPRTAADREKLHRLQTHKQVTGQELHDSGLLDRDADVPRLPGDGKGFMGGDYGAGRAGVEMLGAMGGIVAGGPMALERSLVRGAIARGVMAGRTKGFARLGGVQQNLKLQKAYASPTTLPGRAIKEGSEYMLPGAIADANRAASEGHDPIETGALSAALNMGLGSAFPAAIGMAKGVASGAREFGAGALDGARIVGRDMKHLFDGGIAPHIAGEESGIDMAPQPDVAGFVPNDTGLDKLRKLAMPAVAGAMLSPTGQRVLEAPANAARLAGRAGEKISELDTDPRLYKGALAASGAYAVGNMEGLEDPEQNEMLGTAALGAGTLLSKGKGDVPLPKLKHPLLHKPNWDYEAAYEAGGISKAAKEVFDEGWTFNEIEPGRVDVISPEGDVVATKPSVAAGIYTVVQAKPKGHGDSYVIRKEGGLYSIYDNGKDYVTSFASQSEAVEYAAKAGKKIELETHDRQKPSARAGIGLLARTVEQRVKEYRAVGQHKPARNLRTHMKGSVVRTPLVHATRASFDTFDRGEVGFHLTADPAAAEYRLPLPGSGSVNIGNLMPVWANIKKPLRVDDPGQWNDAFLLDLKDKYNVLSEADYKRALREMYELENRLRDSSATYAQTSYRQWAPVREILKEKGYDGIVYRNSFEGGGDSYIAFDRHQLKSATGNSGAFDPKVGSLIGGAAITAKLLADRDDENKTPEQAGLALAALLFATRGHGPGLVAALKGELEDVEEMLDFRQMQIELFEKDVANNEAFGFFSEKGKRNPLRKGRARSLSANHRINDYWRWREEVLELGYRWRALKTAIERGEKLLDYRGGEPPEQVADEPPAPSGKKASVILGGTIAGAAATDDEEGNDALAGAALAAGVIAAKGKGFSKAANELAQVTARRAELAEKLKAFHADPANRADPARMAAATEWRNENRQLQARQAELEQEIEAAQPKGPRKLKPLDKPAFFSRADKFFDEGGLDAHIKRRKAEPSTATEWKEMLLGEDLNDVSRTELQIRLGEQLDIAEEEGRTLTRQDVREMLADNPVKVQVHVVGKPIGQSVEFEKTLADLENLEQEWYEKHDSYLPANTGYSMDSDANTILHLREKVAAGREEGSVGDIDIARGQIENSANYDSGANGADLSTSPFRDWTFEGGEDYRSLVITAEPTKRYRNPVPQAADTKLYVRRSPDLEGWDVYDAQGNMVGGGGASKDDAMENTRELWRREGRPGRPQFGDATKWQSPNPKYDEPHYGQGGWIPGGGFDNVIAHLRIITRMVDGKKTLHIEEAQSTLGQKIAKFGADNSPERAAKITETAERLAEIKKEIKALLAAEEEGNPRNLDDAAKRRKEYSRAIKAMAAEINRLPPSDPRSRALVAERAELIRKRGGMPLKEQAERHESLQALERERAKLLARQAELKDIEEQRNAPALPLTAGIGEYTDTLLRTALDIAAREGHERIVWTGGLDQTQRFDSGFTKLVDKLLYDPKTNAIKATYTGKPVEGVPSKLTPTELRAWFGNNVADKLLSGEKTEQWQGAVYNKVEGEEISVGKKGMVNFYDLVIPAWFEKEARRLGIKVEFSESTIEDARKLTDVGAEDLSIGTEAHPLDLHRDELEYRIDQMRAEGAAPGTVAIARRVLYSMDNNDVDFQEAVSWLTPEKRQMLANAMGEDTFSPGGGVADRSARVQGFDVPEQLVERIFEGNYLYANPLRPTEILKLYKQYPTVFAGGALGAGGYALSDLGDETENRKLEWSGYGLMALGAVHGIGAHAFRGKPLYQYAAAKGGNKIVDAMKNMNVAGVKGRHVLDFISHDILASPELRKAADDFERGRAKAAARSLEFKAKLKRLGDIGNRAVTDILTGEMWETEFHKLTPEQARAVVAAAEMLRQEFHDLGLREVYAGTMAKGQFEKYDLEYAPYMYPEYEALRALGVGGGEAPTAVPRIKANKTRGDLPRATREKMGQIRESDYLAQQRILKGYNNIAAAKLFSALTMIQGAVHPQYEKAMADLVAANKSGSQKRIKQATNKLKRLQLEAKGDLDRGKLAGYRTLPHSPGLGPLAGAIVRNDIASYLEGLPAFGKRTLVDDLFMQWKKIHTVWNPGTHIGNFVSNIVTVHMKGLPITSLFKPGAGNPLARAYSEIRAYGPYARALTEAGVMDQNIATMDYAAGSAPTPRSALENLRELAGRTLPHTENKLRDMEIRPHGQQEHKTIPGKAASNIAYAGREVDKKLALAYNLEDNVFRVALLQQVTRSPRRGGMGLNMRQGVEYVRHHMGDFRTRSSALKAAKWYSPFIMYPAKMLPHMLGSVVEHPFRWMTLAAGWGVLDQLGAYAVGEGDYSDVRGRIKSGMIDEMDMQEEQRPARGFGYLVPGPIQIPVQRNNMKFASDISRYTPFSSLSGMAAPGSLAAAISSRIPAIAAPGGPLADVYARAINTDPFTGERFIDPDAPWLEKAAKLGGSLVGNQIAPSAITWHLPRVLKDIDNRDWDKAAIDAFGFAGARPRTVIPGQRAKQDKYWKEDALEDAKRELKKELRLSAKSPAQQERLKEKYAAKKLRIKREYIRRNTRPE